MKVPLQMMDDAYILGTLKKHFSKNTEYLQNEHLGRFRNLGQKQVKKPEWY